MNRRDARKAIAITLGADPSVAYVEAGAGDVDLVILKTSRTFSREQCERLRARWLEAVQGTGLDGASVIVVDADVTIELLRKHG